MKIPPPEVPGLPALRWSDRLRHFWWTLIGPLYFAAVWDTKVGPLVRMGNLLLGLAILVLTPLLLPVYLIRPFGKYKKVYISPDRKALLVVTATRGGWEVSDFVTACPRKGYGRALEEKVLAVLQPAADRQKITVSLVAAHEKLAQRYESNIPGLERRKGLVLRGVRMVRPPQ